MRIDEGPIVGVLGGSSPVSTRKYQKLMDDGMRAQLGGWHSASMLIRSVDFQKSVEYVRTGNWSELGTDLTKEVARLVRADISVLIAASNSWHNCSAEFTRALPREIPFVDIADPTADTIRAKGLTRVALFGTKQTMELDFMVDRYKQHGIQIIRPKPEERIAIDRMIFDEFVHDRFEEAARLALLNIMNRMRLRDCVEGVILGCTELGDSVGEEDVPNLPIFDTTKRHCAFMVDWLVSKMRSSH